MENPLFISAYEKLGGVVWLPRLLRKIRINASGKLPADYQPHLGKGFDGRCVRFLGVAYEDVVARVMQGASDEEVLAWLTGLPGWPTEERIAVWNDFLSKRGWRDLDVPPAKFQEYKVKYGQGHRDDILTYFDFYDVDEGRRP